TPTPTPTPTPRRGAAPRASRRGRTSPPRHSLDFNPLRSLGDAVDAGAARAPRGGRLPDLRAGAAAWGVTSAPSSTYYRCDRAVAARARRLSTHDRRRTHGA